MLQSAGSLATTHEVLDRIDRDLDDAGEHESLATVGHLFEAALYVGRLSREVAAEHRELDASAPTATATFILGGQIARRAPGHPARLPGGQLHPASDDRPFLQIGESKYGKFMLELAVRGPRRPASRRPRSRSAR